MVNYDQYIEGLINKDEEAFEVVYQNTKHLVYSIIIAIVKDKFTGEDLMQDTYITMLEKIHQYQKGKNFVNWLLVIARNKAIDYYRHKQKEIVIENEDYIFPQTHPTGERSLLINEMLDSLTEIERSVFLLSIMKRLKRKEIAKILNLPLGTVLWHYHKAIKKINKINGSDISESKE